jgi:hypothetical protein
MLGLLMQAQAFKDGDNIVELIDEGKPTGPGPGGKLQALNAAAAKDAAVPGDGTQTGRMAAGPSGPRPNFPGTPYGKPGYKESHNWESDIDWFTPLIFNPKIYASMYKLKGKTEEQVKKDWLDVALKKDAKYPKCRQGTLTFSPNKYYRANPDIASITKGECRKIVESFLKDGLYEGRKTESGAVEKRYERKLLLKKLREKMRGNVAQRRFCNPRRHWQCTWGIRRNKGSRYASFQSKNVYTLAWWQKANGLMRPWTNILHYGKYNHERAPAVWFYPGNNPRFHIRISQANSWNWGCDPGHAIGNRRGHWYYVAVVVGKRDKNCYRNCKAQATIYYDGKKVGQCNSNSVTRTYYERGEEEEEVETMSTTRKLLSSANRKLLGRKRRPPRRRLFWIADPWYTASRVVMKNLIYYPGTALDGTIIDSLHKLNRGRLR